MVSKSLLLFSVMRLLCETVGENVVGVGKDWLATQIDIYI